MFGILSGSVEFSGKGCPSDRAPALRFGRTSDSEGIGAYLSVIYLDHVAGVPSPYFQRSSECRISVDLDVPEGYSLSVDKLEHQGYLEHPVGDLKVTFASQVGLGDRVGEARTVDLATALKPSVQNSSGAYWRVDDVIDQEWTRCDRSVKELTLRTMLVVSGSIPVEVNALSYFSQVEDVMVLMRINPEHC